MEKSDYFWLFIVGILAVIVLIFCAYTSAIGDKVTLLSEKLEAQQKAIVQNKTAIEYLKGYLRAKENNTICVME